MKKFNMLFVLAALLVLSQIGYSQSITTSSHNFSSAAWNSTGEICIVCHTPHNANTTVAEAPLWNHALSTATYTPYSNAVSMNASVGAPDGSSKLCLSCHDGTIALENFAGNAALTDNRVTGAALIGVDLRNDHPVSFTYDATLASNDGGLHNPATALSGLGGTITDNLLSNGKMQCSSCHDVHNGAGIAHLLVKSNAGSALCLTCHNK